jgi:nucleoside phosphorylase
VCSAGWEADTKPELHPCTTLGFLITEDDEAVVIASTLSLGSNNARMMIPKAWIKKRKEIKIETPKRKSKRKVVATVGTGPVNNPIWTK